MLLSATELVSRSIKLYRDNIRLFLTYSGLMFIPTVLATFAGYTIEIVMQVTGSFFMGLGLYLLLIILLSLCGFLVSIALIKAISQRYQGEQTLTVSKELHENLPHLIPGILIVLLMVLAILAGGILLIIPGIIFAVWFGFSIQALVLDNKYGIDALKTSKQLTQARWFGVLGRVLLPGLIIGALYMTINWLFQLILGLPTADYMINPTPAFTISMVLYGIFISAVSVLLTPFTTATTTILYIELKKNPILLSQTMETKEEEPPKE